MILETSRFGQLEVDETRLICFEEGVLGFPTEKKYDADSKLVKGSGFYWLQSVEVRDLAFVVCDPRLFVPDYQVPVKAEELQTLELDDPSHGQVFVIVNKVDDLLTGNFQGPVVVNVENRKARQLVLSDKRYSTRHPLMRIPKPETMSKTA